MVIDGGIKYSRIMMFFSFLFSVRRWVSSRVVFFVMMICVKDSRNV